MLAQKFVGLVMIDAISPFTFCHFGAVEFFLPFFLVSAARYRCQVPIGAAAVYNSSTLIPREMS